MKEGPTTKKHKENTQTAKAAIITLSDTRTMNEDDSGKLISSLLSEKGHTIVDHVVIPDNKDTLISKVNLFSEIADIIITNGGTGISRKDITVEALKPLFLKEITSFNPLFAKLSYEDIGSSALMSRAIAGIIGKTAVFSIPGSPKAVELAMKKLILPEIGHVIKHLGE